MAYRIMNARYPGQCRGCGSRIGVGTSMSYGGKGLTYHATCHTGTEANEPAFVAHDRRAAREGISILRNGSGEVLSYRNSRGTCEDAPCCGCCS